MPMLTFHSESVKAAKLQISIIFRSFQNIIHKYFWDDENTAENVESSLVFCTYTSLINIET